MGSYLEQAMTARVYIVNRGPHNYQDAEQFGELVFCSEGTLDKLDTNNMYRELADAMKDSIPEDWILVTSLATLCSVACAIFAAKHSCLNLLIFHDGRYLPRTLMFHNEVPQQEKQNGHKRKKAYNS